MLPSPFSPSPPFLPGCRGDRVSERHFFPEAPLSLFHGFVQAALLTGSIVYETQGGKRGSKTSLHLPRQAGEPAGIFIQLQKCHRKKIQASVS